jgi:nucleotide-binding universal stress UspA family protein
VIAQAIQEGERLLAGFHHRLALAESVSDFVHVGHAATGIVEIAEKWAADLIVMGSHGREGLGRLLLGSVADAVIRHAPCPVLVARAKG